MKILHMTKDLRDAGNGIVNVAVDLACAQSAAGNEVHFFSRGGEFVHLLEDQGVRCHIVAPAIDVVSTLRWWRELRAVTKEQRFDIVHAHVISLCFLGWLLGFRHRFRLVSTVHNEYQRGVALMALADRVVSVSSAVDRKMGARQVSKSKRSVITNGTIGTLRRPRPENLESLTLSDQAIVCVGAVSQRKGSDVLLEAFIELASSGIEAELYFVGNVDWPEIRDRADASSYSDRINFIGLCKTPQKFMAEAAVVVLASRADPYPLALCEAREVGAAIVASAVDGIPELLDFGYAGCLVSPGNSRNLAVAIAKVLNDASHSQKLRAGALENLHRFEVARMVREYDDVYAH